MEYTKGQILNYHYPKRTVLRIKKSNVIFAEHKIVVLHSRGTPYNTVLVAPITSASSIKSRGNIPSNYVELLQTDYQIVLEHNSYINLDMCLVVDEKELNKLERYNKKIKCLLNDNDMDQLDYKIILTYELSKYINNALTEELNREFENVIQLINDDTKTKIVNVLSRIDDVGIKRDILEILNKLTDDIRYNYIKK